jgi:hypothetical protein
VDGGELGRAPAVCRFEIHSGEDATVLRQTYLFDGAGSTE